MKRCPRCGRELPIEAFWHDRRRPDGRAAHCVECKSAINAASRARNPEQRRAASRAWNRANRERQRANAAAWREANRERYNARQAANQRERRARAAPVAPAADGG